MLAARQLIYEQDARSTLSGTSVLTGATASPSTPLGTIAETRDGRVYQWAYSGGTALLAGKLTTGPATTANHVTQTGVALAVGATSVTYTLGATATTQDQYASGYFAVNVGPGQNLYKIKGNTVASASNSYSVTVSLSEAEPITVATTTSSKFSLYPQLFNQTVITTAAATQPCSGVPNVPVPVNYYYWSQVGGMASVLSDGVIGKNAQALVSASVNGAAVVEGTSAVTQRIAYAPEATVDTAYLPLFLTLVR
jgi:hypothetical protein